MNKKIYINSKQVGYLKITGEVCISKNSSYEQVGRINKSKKTTVFNSYHQQLAFIEYKNGKYCAFVNEKTEIIIIKHTWNKVTLNYGEDISVDNASPEEILGVAILLSKYRTKQVANNNTSGSTASTKKLSNSSSVINLDTATREERQELLKNTEEDSANNSSKVNKSSKSKKTGIFTIVIVVAFIIGLIVTQFKACTPMGKLSGQYIPTNRFIYEVDQNIEISGTIYIELKNEGRYHLYYNMSKPTQDTESIWGDWTENNGIAVFDNSLIVMKPDKTIHVTIYTRYYKDGEYRYQNVTHILEKR